LKVQLKPTKTPTFVTVSGATGNIPSPFVMNPGRWAVTIKIEQNLFVVSLRAFKLCKYSPLDKIKP